LNKHHKKIEEKFINPLLKKVDVSNKFNEDDYNLDMQGIKVIYN
jgi:hypothetical protein